MTKPMLNSRSWFPIAALSVAAVLGVVIFMVLQHHSDKLSNAIPSPGGQVCHEVFIESGALFFRAPGFKAFSAPWVSSERGRLIGIHGIDTGRDIHLFLAQVEHSSNQGDLKDVTVQVDKTSLEAKIVEIGAWRQYANLKLGYAKIRYLHIVCNAGKSGAESLLVTLETDGLPDLLRMSPNWAEQKSRSWVPWGSSDGDKSWTLSGKINFIESVAESAKDSDAGNPSDVILQLYAAAVDKSEQIMVRRSAFDLLRHIDHEGKWLSTYAGQLLESELQLATKGAASRRMDDKTSQSEQECPK